MGLTINNKQDLPLLGRTRVEATLANENATTSRATIQKMLAKEFKTEPALVIVHKIDQRFGELTCSIQASVYKDKKVLETLESKGMKKRNAIKEEKKEEAKEAQAEAPKAEDAKGE